MALDGRSALSADGKIVAKCNGRLRGDRVKNASQRSWLGERTGDAHSSPPFVDPMRVVHMTSSTSPRAALILVVEEHPLQRFGMIDLVEDAGFAAIEARDADQADDR